MQKVNPTVGTECAGYTADTSSLMIERHSAAISASRQCSRFRALRGASGNTPKTRWLQNAGAQTSSVSRQDYFGYFNSLTAVRQLPHPACNVLREVFGSYNHYGRRLRNRRRRQ